MEMRLKYLEEETGRELILALLPIGFQLPFSQVQLVTGYDCRLQAQFVSLSERT